jgi:SAM-dependent methyltransferase
LLRREYLDYKVERQQLMSLWRDFLLNDQRIIHKWKHYFPAYERHFAKFVNTDVTFLEIGCFRGGSLQMWKRFLGPHARIVGIDIDPNCASLEEDQIKIRIGDQSDHTFLASLVDEFGPFDVVLDDGSHIMAHIKASFDFLYPRVSRNGVYFVEDLHTAYWDEYGGGLRRDGSFIEFCKNLIDDLNADFSRGTLAPSEFTRSTLSMHFYDSLCVFEKGRTLTKEAPKTGRDT